MSKIFIMAADRFLMYHVPVHVSKDYNVEQQGLKERMAAVNGLFRRNQKRRKNLAAIIPHFRHNDHQIN